MAVASRERVVSYFYDEEIGNFCYGGGNPMRPHRARMVFSLLDAYGLKDQMKVHRPIPRTYDQLTEFHADDYIDFLRSVTPSSAEDHMNQLKRFNMGQIGDVDCPVFDGVYEYCQIYAGGSVSGAQHLAEGKADVAFNWSGGMHHAKKAEASGFCYVNDIVLAILELLKVYARVLYVDIDIHHGDGVEEAFYLTDRVMTVSFHKYGEFFPGTGHVDDVGFMKGKYYTVNVPLKDGMDDDNYRMMFEPIMSKVMEMYQPNAIVMCCGADSLSGDKLGCFNLSMEGHSHCIEFLAKYNVPLLVLGGGGYTLRNVARCWTFETGRIMGRDLPDELPDKALKDFNYYLDTGHLRISVSNMKNTNTREELEQIKTKVLEHLSQLPPAPSVQMAYQPAMIKQDELPEEDPDARGGGQVHEEWRNAKPGDVSDDEDMGEHVSAPPRSTPPASPLPHGTGVSPSPAAVKQEPSMQAADIHTSEALQGPGINHSAAANGRPSPQPGASASPGGQAPMDVDGAAGEPASARESGGGAGVMLGASMQSGGSYVAGASNGGGAGAVEAGTNGVSPSISMLGPSSALSPLSGSAGGAQPAMKSENNATGAGLRPNIIGASLDSSGGGAPVGSPPPAAHGGSEGGIYRPQ